MLHPNPAHEKLTLKSTLKIDGYFQVFLYSEHTYVYPLAFHFNGHTYITMYTIIQLTVSVKYRYLVSYFIVYA